MSTSGAPAGGPGEVRVDIEMLEAYLKDVLMPLEAEVRSACGQFASVPLDPQMFGPVPQALELAERHRWSFSLYQPTLDALASDVGLLIEKLQKVIRQYRDQDDQVETALLKLAQNLGGSEGYSSAGVLQREYATHGGAPTQSMPTPGATVPMTGAVPAAVAPPVQPAAADPPRVETPKPSGSDGF